MSMEDKRPIDRIRTCSGAAYIGSDEDGAIVDMINTSERLIILKEKAIYEHITADKVDPERMSIFAVYNGLDQSLHA